MPIKTGPAPERNRGGRPPRVEKITYRMSAGVTERYRLWLAATMKALDYEDVGDFLKDCVRARMERDRMAPPPRR
jgi:hypothetical protein